VPTEQRDTEVSPYLEFSRAEWARLRETTPLPLSEAQLRPLAGINEPVSIAEVTDIYLPLSRLLNLRVAATKKLHAATSTFLGTTGGAVPYVIGIAGSVAVGKSTTSRILQALLSHWPSHPQVDLVTTDGFLMTREALEAKGLMQRKGFPESYDVRRIVQFMSDLNSGLPEVRAPRYSHLAYDIVPGEYQVVRQPDIVIVEGLNVLQAGDLRRRTRLFVSDFFDFSIYVDAHEADIEQWYVERFMKLRETVFRDPSSFFHRYALMPSEEAHAIAHGIWNTINLPNLRQNIAPTRDRAHLILTKGRDHAVRRVRLRKL
jgi:type I pantothenate kinase